MTGSDLFPFLLKISDSKSGITKYYELHIHVLAYFYAPAIKWQGAFSVCFVRPSVIHPSVIWSSVPSKFVFSTPPTSLNGFEWNLVQILCHKSRSACGKIIHVRQISAEFWPLTLRIFTHFSLSSQLLLLPCMDLNENWQGCCTTSLEVHVGR